MKLLPLFKELNEKKSIEYNKGKPDAVVEELQHTIISKDLTSFMVH